MTYPILLQAVRSVPCTSRRFAYDWIVAQIAVTYEWSDWRNGVIWRVQSVFVHANYRRQGVYSSLYRHVESQARSDSNVIGIRLYVEKDNERAQTTYTDLGMKMTNYRIMQDFFDR